MCHFSPSNCTLGVCGGKFLYNNLRGNKLASFHAFIGYDITKRVMLLRYLPLSEIPVTHTFANVPTISSKFVSSFPGCRSRRSPRRN